MKKRGVSTLFLVILAIVIIVVAGIVYYYTTKEKVELTQEEKETAKKLDLTPKEFRDVSVKAEEYFKKNEPLLYNERALKYSKIQKEAISDYGVGDVKIKPDSKIIQVQFVGIQPPPNIIYLIENGKVKIIAEDLEPEGL